MKIYQITRWSLFTLSVLSVSLIFAQPQGFNYDESKVPTFTLPDPLVLANGQKVVDAKTWREKRRPEILKLFEEQVYGRSPQPRDDMSFEVSSVDKQALGGKAIRKEVTVYFSADKAGPQMSVLIYLPAKVTGPRPAFLAYNFFGNHSIHPDPGITLSKCVFKVRMFSNGKSLSRSATSRRMETATLSRCAAARTSRLIPML